MQILRAAEDYLEAMLMMQQKHGYIRSIDIAEQLGVTKPSVTYTTKRLRENGYITMDRDVLIEASKTVRGRYPDTEHVRFRTLPPVTYAGCVYRGSYAQISDVIAAVAAWVAANGYESAGPMFNIYHVSPHETQNPDEFVTEVCFPVREA